MDKQTDIATRRMTAPAWRSAAPPGPGMTYAWTEPPAPSETIEVAPGVLWLRMPLPYALDHINLWALADGDGWTLVDTGIGLDEVKALWRGHFADSLGGKPVRRVIVTHFHPDHFGLAGWLAEATGAEVWMTRTEWLTALTVHRDQEQIGATAQVEFFTAHGLVGEHQTGLANRGNRYRKMVAAPPGAYRRIADGETIRIGAHDWRVIVGTGHAPEHACLYCGDLGVFISGDQVLPKITPNVSLHASEQDADPLKNFLDSLERFRGLGTNGTEDDVLVLPSHEYPFRGLEARLDSIRAHHDERLAEVVAACDTPKTAAEVVPVLFRRELDTHQMMFAMGECLSHLAFLAAGGRLVQSRGNDGIWRFSAP